MELFNEFFVSFEVVIGPKIVFISKSKIGNIILFPSQKNIFVKEPSNCFIYDNGDIELSEAIQKFSLYTDTPIVEIKSLCNSIWSEEIGLEELFIEKDSTPTKLWTKHIRF